MPRSEKYSLKIAISKKTALCCFYCGSYPGTKSMQIDHFIPKALGGSDHIENLVLACKPCNASKNNRTIEEFRSVRIVQNSAYSGIISSTQAIRLVELGAVLDLPDHKFWFELNDFSGVAPV